MVINYEIANEACEMRTVLPSLVTEKAKDARVWGYERCERLQRLHARRSHGWRAR